MKICSQLLKLPVQIPEGRPVLCIQLHAIGQFFAIRILNYKGYHISQLSISVIEYLT
jgi:hypothetical protein